LPQLRSAHTFEEDDFSALRPSVYSAVGDLLAGRFTRDSEELIDYILKMLPGFSQTEAVILLSASGAAVRNVLSLHHSWDTLRRVGRLASATERDISTQIVYIGMDPRWASRPVSPSPPILPQSGVAQLVSSWLGSARRDSETEGLVEVTSLPAMTGSLETPQPTKTSEPVTTTTPTLTTSTATPWRRLFRPRQPSLPCALR